MLHSWLVSYGLARLCQLSFQLLFSACPLIVDVPARSHLWHSFLLCSHTPVRSSIFLASVSIKHWWPCSRLQGDSSIYMCHKSFKLKTSQIECISPQTASSSCILFISVRQHSPCKYLRRSPLPLIGPPFYNWSICNSGHLSFFFISLGPIQLCPPPLPWTITGVSFAISLNLSLPPSKLPSHLLPESLV